MVVCCHGFPVNGVTVGTDRSLERRLVLAQDRQDVVHLVQSLKEWNEVEQLSVIGVIKPRGHRHLVGESQRSEVSW